MGRGASSNSTSSINPSNLSNSSGPSNLSSRPTPVLCLSLQAIRCTVDSTQTHHKAAAEIARIDNPTSQPHHAHAHTHAHAHAHTQQHQHNQHSQQHQQHHAGRDADIEYISIMGGSVDTTVGQVSVWLGPGAGVGGWVDNDWPGGGRAHGSSGSSSSSSSSVSSSNVFVPVFAARGCCFGGTIYLAAAGNDCIDVKVCFHYLFIWACLLILLVLYASSYPSDQSIILTPPPVTFTTPPPSSPTSIITTAPSTPPHNSFPPPSSRRCLLVHASLRLP